MGRKTGLGRGLDALIPSGGEESTIPSSGITQVPVGNIQPNPHQPRNAFDIESEDMQDLAASIREHGIIQPLVVAKGNQDGQYVLIAGQRRLKAAELAGLAEVPVIIRDVSDREFLLLALIENLQRADLSPLETAEAYKNLVEGFNLTHEEVADRVGKSRTAVTNTLGLLNMAPAVIKALAEGEISEGHARALKGLPNQGQSSALITVIKKGYNVRMTEELVQKLKGDKPQASAPKPLLDPDVLAVQFKLQDALGTKVSLSHGKKGGKITVYYYSDEELNKLVDKLTGENEET